MTTPLCGATKTDGSGNTCRHQAGWGTDHPGHGPCRKHGGNTRNHRRAAQDAAARTEVEQMSLRRDIHPLDALVEEVQHVAGDVAYLRQKIRAMGMDDLIDTVFTEGGSHRVVGPEVTLYWQAHDRLVRVSTAALKAGVDERRVRVEEAQQNATAEFMRAVIAEFGIPDTPDTWDRVRQQWTVVQGGAA